MLTGLQQYNNSADEGRCIQAIMDLEWARSTPIQMQLAPFWLTSLPGG